MNKDLLVFLEPRVHSTVGDMDQSFQLAGCVFRHGTDRFAFTYDNVINLMLRIFRRLQALREMLFGDFTLVKEVDGIIRLQPPIIRVLVSGH